ncbi:MAG: ribosome-associated translation inhibitor RaiA [Candidatus Komeilibacteria bacterium]|nr:ribosome-associated translation inhibitor RaiA [Candidatus Komeilibacteria bacterium]
MPYQIYAKNLDLTAPLKEYIDLKMKKLAKFIKNNEHYQIDLSRDAHHKKGEVFRAEINLAIANEVFRAVEIGPDIRSALDVARDKMFLQINKIKQKKISARRAGGKK